VLVTFGVVLLTLLSYGPVADALLWPLEKQYPVYERGNHPPTKFVVVLGGGHNSDSNLPITSQIGNETLKRLIEGIRVYRQNPGSKLVLSGGDWLDPMPDAKVMEDVARVLGIDEADTILESESKDTMDEAKMLKTFLATNDFVLVTSAIHMPRSVALFAKEDMKGVPGPAEHLVRARHIEPDLFFPSGGNLWDSERAAYEYMSLAWGKLNAGAVINRKAHEEPTAGKNGSECYTFSVANFDADL